MTSIETKFRSLSRLAAECQRQVERLYQVDSSTVHKEVSELIKNNIRSLEEDIQVKRVHTDTRYINAVTKVVKQLAEEEDRESSKLAVLNRLGEYEHQLRQ